MASSSDSLKLNQGTNLKRNNDLIIQIPTSSINPDLKSDWAHLLKNNKTAIAAGSSGIISVLVGHPFDTLKTRMQVADPPIPLSKCYQDIVQRHGHIALWRGVAGPLCVVSFLKGFSFTCYDTAARTLIAQSHAHTSPFTFKPFSFSKLISLPHHSAYQIPFNQKLPSLMAAGTLTGVITVMLSGPLELVKVQLQLGRQKTTIPGSEVVQAAKTKVRENTFTCIRRIYKLGGLSGFYRGVSAHFLRDGFGTAIYFGGYETIKHFMSRLEAFPFSVNSLISGGLAGTLSWCVLFPIDVVKSRIQREAFLPKQHQLYQGSIWRCIQILRKSPNGYRTFYAGLPPTLLRALPIHALNFTVYENILSYINEL